MMVLLLEQSRRVIYGRNVMEARKDRPDRSTELSKDLLTGVLKEAVPQLTATEASAVVNRLMGALFGELVASGALNLSGVGRFSVRQSASRSTRHPATGELVHVAARPAVKFKASSSLQQALDAMRSGG